jgi:hypothetical protein
VSETKRYRQVELRDGNTRLVCWVDDRPDLKPHVSLTLKDLPDVRWHVAWVSTMVQDQHQRRTWRVGGIDAR